MHAVVQTMTLFAELVHREIGPPEGTMTYLTLLSELIGLDASKLPADVGQSCFVGPEGASSTA